MILYTNGKTFYINRFVKPSIYLNYFVSSCETALDLKIFKLQIDNQIRNADFKVAFSRFLPIKTSDETSKRNHSNLSNFVKRLA